MKRVFTIGSAMRDIFIEIKNPHTMSLDLCEGDESPDHFIILKEGHKISVQNLIYKLGGGGINSAMSFKTLGHDVSSFFKIGNDEAGKAIMQELTTADISINQSIESTEHSTGTSFIIPCPSGNRAILVYRGASTTITKQEVSTISFKEYDACYCTSLSGPTSHLFLPLAQQIKKAELFFAANPGTSQLVGNTRYFLDALSYIDVLIVNAYEAELLFNALFQSDRQNNNKSELSDLPRLLNVERGAPLCFDLYDFFEHVHAKGPSIVVVTNDVEGVYASDKKSIYFHPAEHVPVISSVGAGDSFGSCFVSYLLKGYPLSHALKAGILNAASVIQSIGAQDDLLTEKYIEYKIQSLDPNQLLTIDYPTT